MVHRVLRLVYQEVRGLHQAAYILALFTFGSQVLALVRDRLLAGTFGAGAELDIYYAAFRIPDLLFVLFASSLSVYVLIPFVAKFQEKEDSEGARNLLSQIFSLFLIAYAVLAIVMGILAPYITPLLFPGIADQETLVMVLRVLLLQPLLLGVSSLFGVITQLQHRFVLYAVSPLLYNIGIILGILLLYPWLGLPGIAVGVCVGALAHMAVQLPLVRSSALAFFVTNRFNWQQIREVLLISIPRAITLSFNQITLLVLIGFASMMAVGSVSVFQFAFNLQSVPLAVIGASYSVAAFPVLAKLHAAAERTQFIEHLTTALRHIIFWSVPAAILIIVLRAQIVRVILGSGAFDWDDTRLTAAILAILVIALFAQAINLLLIRAFYASGDTKTPLAIVGAGSVLSIASAYFFVQVYESSEAIRLAATQLMRVYEVAGSEVIALAFGYTVALIVQSGALLYCAERAFSLPTLWFRTHFMRAIIAAVIGGIAAYAALQFLVAGLNTDTFIGILLQGALAGSFGVIGVVIGYAMQGSPELKEVMQAFGRRIFKTDVVAPQKDLL